MTAPKDFVERGSDEPKNVASDFRRQISGGNDADERADENGYPVLSA
jgi:hypothetical protein